MIESELEQLIHNRMQLHGESYMVAQQKLSSAYSEQPSGSLSPYPLDLIFSDEDQARLRLIRDRSTSLTLISGPAGSGKTSTLQSLVEFGVEKYPLQRTILIEDLLEVKFSAKAAPPSVIQFVANNDYSAEDLIRQASRRDPDTVAFQEIESDLPRGLVALVETGHHVLTTMLNVPFGNPLALNRHLRNQVYFLSAIVEQVSIAGKSDGSSTPSRNILTNVILMKPELKKIIKYNERDAEVEYFNNPSNPTMSSKLAGLLSEGVIRETISGFELC